LRLSQTDQEQEFIGRQTNGMLWFGNKGHVASSSYRSRNKPPELAARQDDAAHDEEKQRRDEKTGK
jgi:hypothetical protein